MPDIRKRDGKKPYQVRFVDPSKQSGFGYKSFRTSKESRAFAAKQELIDPSTVRHSEINSVSEGIDRWLEIARTEGLKNPGEPVSAATLEQYEYRARIMKVYSWPVPLNCLDELHMMDFRT